ncbi:MAG: DNA cytosine methyltransferase, partial [Proteobacteria bacterium]|nr:DNA cytosine methyltransferase [Pseudomonadota bacterium]
MTGPTIKAVDLFCGVGGLTHGLLRSGIDVRLGVDLDAACEFPFTANNEASFRCQSVTDLSGKHLSDAWRGADMTLLAGCAPCQPFSTYSQSWASPEDERWDLLSHFARLVRESQPDLVTMENVPKLAKMDVFSLFLDTLERQGYQTTYKIVTCTDYGVPQARKRLVLLASRLGEIDLIQPTTRPGRYKTVRSAIAALPPISAGQGCALDPLHQCSELSELNMKRMRASKPGGSWRDWPRALVADCHTKNSGKTFPGVYGRMTWDDPSPTITTQYYGFGNGRFGHPEQDRGLSLREGAILQ